LVSPPGDRDQIRDAQQNPFIVSPLRSVPTASAEDGPHVNGQVIAVEYQGSMVWVAVTTDAGDEVSALVPDQMFWRKPAEPGDLATLVWSEQDTHALMEA
jgi:hypothetical protein